MFKILLQNALDYVGKTTLHGMRYLGLASKVRLREIGAVKSGNDLKYPRSQYRVASNNTDTTFPHK